MTTNYDSRSAEGCTTGGKTFSDSYINFEVVRSISSLENCVFAVAQELHSSQGLIDFLARSGFTVSAPIEQPRVVMQFHGIDSTGWNIGGTIPYDQIPIPLFFPDHFIVYSLFVGVVISDDGTPVMAQAILNRL